MDSMGARTHNTNRVVSHNQKRRCLHWIADRPRTEATQRPTVQETSSPQVLTRPTHATKFYSTLSDLVKRSDSSCKVCPHTRTFIFPFSKSKIYFARLHPKYHRFDATVGECEI